MKDEHKTKKQLINELVVLRQKILKLEATVTERKQIEEELRILAITDSLTQTHNR